jgi:TonB family protein
MKGILYTITLLSLNATVYGQTGVVEASPPPVQASYGTTSPEAAGDQGEKEIFTSVEQMPEFPGGNARLNSYIAQSIRYPEAARKASIQGRVVVQFVVSKTGEITNATVVRDIGGGCGKEALRVVTAMPKWGPGKQNGKAVNVHYTLPVNFFLEEEKRTEPVAVVAPPPETRPGRTSYANANVQENPEFPGDINAFLKKNLRYPAAAKAKGIEGRVILQFVIDKDGTLKDIVIRKDIGGGCGEEAARVVKMMPRWKPAKQNGAPVKIFYTLPVNFNLVNKTTEKK